MKVFRIEREKYLNTTLTGVGASMAKGFRWNSLNTQLVYTAENRALAILEVSVHLDLTEDLPIDRYILEIDIPEDLTIQEVKIDELPENWDSKLSGIITQIIGDDFVSESLAPVLKVPSSIVPQEFNYLINPRHPDAGRIKVIAKTAMRFDPRFNVK